MKSFHFIEWLVILSTLNTCSFLGYAIGFGVGLGAATVLYLFYGNLDTRAQLVHLDEEGNFFTYHSGFHGPNGTRNPKSPIANCVEVEPQGRSEMHRSCGGKPNEFPSRESVLDLPGPIFFGTLPSIEATIRSSKGTGDIYRSIVIDMSYVYRLETSAVALLKREAHKNIKTRTLVSYGVSQNSVVYADLRRGGLMLNFGAQRVMKSCRKMMQAGPLGFEERSDAIKWCTSQIELGLPVLSSDTTVSPEMKPQDINSVEDTVKAFRDLPRKQRLFRDRFFAPGDTALAGHPKSLDDLIIRFKARGGRIQSYKPGQFLNTQAARAIFIVQGRVFFEGVFLAARPYKSRASFSSILISSLRIGRSFLHHSQAVIASLPSLERLAFGTLAARQSFAVVDELLGDESNGAPWMHCDQISISPCETCWTIEVLGDTTGWSLWPTTEQWTFDALIVGKET